MKLLTIPWEKYQDYRLNVIFDGYKWDPQFGDNNTIARHALVISEHECRELEALTEKLAAETKAAELAIINDTSLARPLKLPNTMLKNLKKVKNYNPDAHVRLMRFDFHPVRDGGWAVSEVNSDVPGGFAEASLMPKFALDLFGDSGYRIVDFGKILAKAIADKTPRGGKVALVHCTSFSDDRQVMQFLGDGLKSRGLSVIYTDSKRLAFKNNHAVYLAENSEIAVDFIFRFTPLEWLMQLKSQNKTGFFDTFTASCNFPIGIYAQSKRFPFVWNALEKNGADLSVWRALLPQTLDEKAVKGKQGFIFKPVYGRVGEGISIKEACDDDEYQRIIKDVKRHPTKYIAQKRFESPPLVSDDGDKYYVCIGVYSVDGKPAGFYARVNTVPRIDSNSADIPVIIQTEGDRE